MRKKSAAPRVPLACHASSRRLGNKDVGAKGQDNSIDPRASIDIELDVCLIERTRDVYLQRVSHILSSGGFCSTYIIEFSINTLELRDTEY